MPLAMSQFTPSFSQVFNSNKIKQFENPKDRMKTFLILGSFLVLTNAQYPPSGYGQPEAYSPPGGYGPPGGYPGPVLGESPEQGPPQEEEEDTRPIIIKKHVFVHIAPDDESSGVARRIQAPIPRERQVNILFVKAPAPAAPDQQIVEIPNDGGKKTLVYVLLKKNDASPDPEFKLPAPTQASKPEIYFIRYKDQKPAEEEETPAPTGSEYGAPAPAPVARTPASQKPKYKAPTPPAQPSPQYGAPLADNSVSGGYQKKKRESKIPK